MIRFWSKVDMADGCWEWQAYRDAKGYGCLIVGSRIDGTRRTMLAHRRAYELVFGTIPEGMFICHSCDNPACCRPSHMFIGTAADNAADMVQKGRQSRGERHSATLTREKMQRFGNQNWRGKAA